MLELEFVKAMGVWFGGGPLSLVIPDVDLVSVYLLLVDVFFDGSIEIADASDYVVDR